MCIYRLKCCLKMDILYSTTVVVDCRTEMHDTTLICFHCRWILPSWSHLCVFSGTSVKCKYVRKTYKKGYQVMSHFYELFLRAPNVSDWSDKGCRVLHTGPNGTSCFCNHTTNFAILMNYMKARVCS